MSKTITLILKPNTHSAGNRPAYFEGVDICDDRGSVFAFSHIDLFWTTGGNAVYERLRSGEEVALSILPVATAEEGAPVEAVAVSA